MFHIILRDNRIDLLYVESGFGKQDAGESIVISCGLYDEWNVLVATAPFQCIYEFTDSFPGVRDLQTDIIIDMTKQTDVYLGLADIQSYGNN